MILLTRVRTNPAVSSVFRGPKRNTRELELLRKRRDSIIPGASGKLDLKSDLWKPAKKQLTKESFDKCAYCEASARTVCHCDVEHIRPKSVYWWLALCYDNYVLGCQLCNQVYKGDQYPIQGTQTAEPAVSPQSTNADLQALVGTFAPDPVTDLPTFTRAAFENAFTAEQPGLINPYLDKPEDFFTWLPDADQHQVEIQPRHQSGSKRWRAETSIELLGLNREELRRVRWLTYRPIAQLCRLYASGQLSAQDLTDTQDVLRASMNEDQFFAGLCRWTIREQFALAL